MNITNSLSQAFKILISLLFLLSLLFFVDKEEFWGLDINWGYLWEFIFIACLLMLMFGYRWKVLLPSKVPTATIMHSSVIGLGGNQVLPARGGDLLRIIHIKKYTESISMHRLLSATIIEKFMDLFVLSLLGVAVVSLFVAGGAESSLKQPILIVLCLMFLCVVAVLWIINSGILLHFIKLVCRAIKIKPQVYRHFYIAIKEMEKATQQRRFVWPLVLTFVMWFILYVMSYQAVANMIGLDLYWHELVILVFMGGVGVAIPAAPSGLGVLHASLVAGFVLMGKDASEGLVFAVAVHGIFFITFVIPALCIYLANIVQREFR